MPHLFLRIVTRLALGLTFILAAGAADARPVTVPVRLEQIRVQLLLETTGELSPNVAPPSQAALWNSGIGEGAAGQPVSDALVWVSLRSATPQTFLAGPLVVTVRGRRGRILARRSYEGSLISGGRISRALLVPEISCAGPVTIEAVYGAQRLTSTVDFACGE